MYNSLGVGKKIRVVFAAADIQERVTKALIKHDKSDIQGFVKSQIS